MIREGFTEQVTLGLGLRVCVGVQRQASEGTLQAELHAALSWARWMVWFHFAQRRQVWGRWSSLPCVREARPPPDSLLAFCPYLLPLGQLSGICSILLTWTEWEWLVVASGLPGGKALTPLSVTPGPAGWGRLPAWPGPAVSPPQLPDEEIKHFLILQEEDV